MTVVEAADVELVALPAPERAASRGADPFGVYMARQSPAAARGVRRSLTHIAELIGGPGTRPEQVPWWEIRREHATVIKARLVSTALASTTVNHRLACLRGVLTEARKLGLVSGDDALLAADALRTIRGDRRPAGRHVESGELAALFRHLAGDEGPGARRDAALVAVLAAAGPRRAEVAAARLVDWSPATRQMMFPRTKGRQQRTVPLPAGAVHAIEDWLAVRGSWDGPLFPRISQRGVVSKDAVSPTAVRAMLVRRARRAGVVVFTTHDLRRTLIGELLDAGVDLATAQRFIGHADPKTTARYDRRHERALRDAAERLHVPYIRPERAG